MCKTAKTVDARTTDLSLSFTSLLNKQKNGNEKQMLLITKHPWETWKCTWLEDLLYSGKPTEPPEFTEQVVANL